MKIRRDFVTNSSSSSYILSVKKTDNKKLQKLVDNLLTAIRHQDIYTKEDVKAYLESCYCYKDQTLDDIMNHNQNIYESALVTDLYNEMNQRIENGEKIYVYSLEYDEDIYSNVFDSIENIGLATYINEEEY